MIRYASTVNSDEYKQIDAAFIECGSDYRTRPRIFMPKAPFFDPRFVLRYWSAFIHELECLTNDERKFPLSMYVAPSNVRVRGLTNPPSYTNSTNAERERVRLSAEAGLTNYSNSRTYYQIADKVRQERYEKLNEIAKYDLSRRTFTTPDAQRIDIESYFSPQYFVAKSVFWMRYLARVAEFATPAVKKALREEISRHSSLIGLVEEAFSEFPKDKAILLEHLTSPIPGFRKKYGRVDVSLKEYWDV